MKIRTFISFILLFLLMGAVMPAEAQRVTGKPKVNVTKRFGNNAEKEEDMRVTTKSKPKLKVHHGIVATPNLIYYSGDITTPMEALKYGEIISSFGGSLTLNYKLTFNPYVSMRIGVQGGLLRGTNKKVVEGGGKEFRHEFQSVFIEPYAGVEVYPILNYGFFIYSGFGVTGSFIQKYTHEKRKYTGANAFSGTNAQGVVPMFQFGLGYNWWLDKHWTLGVELLGQLALVDGQKYGLDAWPNKGLYDYDGSEARAYKNAKDPDGWLQLGFVISYHF